MCIIKIELIISIRVNKKSDKTGRKNSHRKVV